MKYGIFLTLIFTSVSAFSADDAEFESLVLTKYQYQTLVNYKTHSGSPDNFTFSRGIERADVVSVRNPIRRMGFATECSGIKLMAASCAVREVFLYAGDQQLNCYVRFESDIGKQELKLKELFECD